MEEEKKKNILEHFSVEVGIIVFVAVIIIGILFYLGVLPFNPSAKKTPPSNTIPAQTNANSPIVDCPVSDALCQSSHAIKVPNADYSWLGWNFTKDSQVFAAFDGTLQQQLTPLTASGSGALYVATITSSNGKYQARYMIPSFKLSKKIKETVLPEKKVKAKDVIFPNNETSTLFQDQNISMSFYVSTTTTAPNSTPIDIDPKKFGKLITLP